MPSTMGDVIDACRNASGSDSEIEWVAESFLLEHGVQPWMELPLWLPDEPDTQGFSRVDISKATDAGLRFRSLGETARDTLAWWLSLPDERRAAPRAGISAEREAELLAEWERV
jgi:2'-hydroxyisoflavone reductase